MLSHLHSKCLNRFKNSPWTNTLAYFDKSSASADRYMGDVATFRITTLGIMTFGKTREIYFSAIKDT
jgi:hypothetical protein